MNSPMDKLPFKNICLRCGGEVPSPGMAGKYPGATSRWDNQTEICSACGLEEGLIELTAGTYRSGNPILAPTNPVRPWWIICELERLLDKDIQRKA